MGSTATFVYLLIIAVVGLVTMKDEYTECAGLSCCCELGFGFPVVGFKFVF